MSLRRHLSLVLSLLCLCSLAGYWGSEARRLPEAALFAGGLLLGLWLPAGVRARLPAWGWTAALLALLAAEAAAVWFSPPLAVERAYEFVRWLLVAKLWTRSSGRDDLQIVLLSFFVLLGAAVYTYTMRLGVFVALYALFAPAGLLLASASALQGASPGGAGPVLPRLRIYVLSAACGVLLLLGGAGIFFVLPRLSASLVQFNLTGASPLRSFASDVDLGARGRLLPGRRIVFEARQTLGPLAEGPWRMLALDRFDGRRWQASPGSARPLAQARPGLFLEGGKFPEEAAAASEWRFDLLPAALPALPAPAQLAGFPADQVLVRGPFKSLARGADGSLQAGEAADVFAVPAVRSYVIGYVEAPWKRGAPPALSAVEQEALTEIPADLDPRIAALARQIAAGASSPGAIALAQAVGKHLSTNYRYDLERRPAGAKDPLAAFLFDERSGHCEYFASAGAVLLRSLGVPARVAVGFAAGEYDRRRRLWTVRESDAHGWVELWDPSAGWLWMDPSPRDLSAEHTRFSGISNAWRDAWQRAEIWWAQWVLRYSISSQIEIAERLSGALPAGLALARRGPAKAASSALRWAPVAVVGALGLVLLGLLWAGRRRPAGPAEEGASSARLARLLGPLKREAKKRGLPAGVDRTALELAASVGAQISPGAAAVLGRWAVSYNEARFGSRLKDAAESRGELARAWKSARRLLEKPQLTRGPARE